MNRIFLIAGGIVLTTAAIAPFLRQPAAQSAAAAAKPGRASPWDKAAPAAPARGDAGAARIGERAEALPNFFELLLRAAARARASDALRTLRAAACAPAVMAAAPS
jgi:hypothetical protein